MCQVRGMSTHETAFACSACSETRRYVPVEVTISPDVGWLFGSKGYLDFVLGAPLHYAVEIMREGKDPEGHLSR